MTTPTRPTPEGLDPGADGPDVVETVEDATTAALVEPLSGLSAPEGASPALATSAGGEPDATDSEATAPAGSGARRSKPLQAVADLLHDLAIAVVVCVLLITYVVQAFKVQGTSMSPELADGERILVNKFLYYLDDIARGDVVVFWYPEDPDLSFIKRVVGLPGETVEIRDGVVFVDGRRLEESYVTPEHADERSHPATPIRPGHYFVLGDNRRGSNDSRSWGLVPERYIYGKAFIRIWPLGDVGFVD